MSANALEMRKAEARIEQAKRSAKLAQDEADFQMKVFRDRHLLAESPQAQEIISLMNQRFCW